MANEAVVDGRNTGASFAEQSAIGRIERYKVDYEESLAWSSVATQRE